MNVRYDDVVDALYIELSEESPEAAIEVSDGINVDTTPTGRIAGIEILDASSRIDLPQKDQNMAMTTPLPLRPTLDLFRENHTEALSLVATCGCCPRMHPGMDYDRDAWSSRWCRQAPTRAVLRSLLGLRSAQSRIEWPVELNT